MVTDEISDIEHFLVIKMEQHENNQTTETPDVPTQTCQSSPSQDCKNKRQCKFVISFGNYNGSNKLQDSVYSINC